jgi:hypothetical protein
VSAVRDHNDAAAAVEWLLQSDEPAWTALGVLHVAGRGVDFAAST